MKKEIFIFILLVVLGLIFECLQFATDLTFFSIKFWILGIICMFLGFCGLIFYGLIPLLEHRANTLGKAKRKQIRNKKH